MASSSLDALKIKISPKAFLPFAKQHNALVAAIEGMEGRGGIKVTITAGKILITPGQSGLPPPNGGGATALPTYTFTACVNGAPMSFDIPLVRGPY